MDPLQIEAQGLVQPGCKHGAHGQPCAADIDALAEIDERSSPLKGADQPVAVPRGAGRGWGECFQESRVDRVVPQEVAGDAIGDP